MNKALEKLRNAFHTYLHSFTEKKLILKTFLAEGAVLFLLWSTLNWLKNEVASRTEQILQGRTPEELKQLLLSSSPEKMLPFLQQTKSFLIFLFVGYGLFFLLGFLFFALSRAYIWNSLHQSRLSTKNYWRWNALMLIFPILLIFYAIISMLVKLFFLWIIKALLQMNAVFYFSHQDTVAGILSQVNTLLNFIFVLIFLIFAFTVGWQFVKKYKVFESLGDGFSLLGKHRKVLSLHLFFAVITTLVISLLLLFVTRTFFLSPQSMLLINAGISLLFLCWFRVYVVRTLQE